MSVFGSRSAVSRPFVAGLFAALLGVAVSAEARQAAAPAPAAAAPAAQAAPEDPFKFTGDAGYFQFLVKPDKTADFEDVWNQIFTKLAASEKPELKELGTSLQMFKLDRAGAAADNVTYLFLASPALKTMSYSISPFLLFESGIFPRAEADALFAKVSATVAGFGAQPLKKLH